MHGHANFKQGFENLSKTYPSQKPNYYNMK